MSGLVMCVRVCGVLLIVNSSSFPPSSNWCIFPPYDAHALCLSLPLPLSFPLSLSVSLSAALPLCLSPSFASPASHQSILTLAAVCYYLLIWIGLARRVYLISITI